MLLHGFLVHVFRNFGTFYDFAVNLNDYLHFGLYSQASSYSGHGT